MPCIKFDRFHKNFRKKFFDFFSKLDSEMLVINAESILEIMRPIRQAEKFQNLKKIEKSIQIVCKSQQIFRGSRRILGRYYFLMILCLKDSKLSQESMLKCIFLPYFGLTRYIDFFDVNRPFPCIFVKKRVTYGLQKTTKIIETRKVAYTT